MRVDVKYAANLKAGDIYAGDVVPDAPTRPVQEFLNAWEIVSVETVETADGKRYTQPFGLMGSDAIALTALPVRRQVMVIAP
jgi:hypothetical protein